MASKSDFETFLAQFWVDFGIISETSGRHFGDFLGTFFQGLFSDGFLCLQVIAPQAWGVPGEVYPLLRGEPLQDYSAAGGNQPEAPAQHQF